MPLLRGDFRIRTRTYTEGLAVLDYVIPEKEVLGEQWMSRDKFALNLGNRTMIIDFKESTVILVNHVDRTYLSTPLPADPVLLLAPERAEMFRGMMKITAAVESLGQARQIGRWKCEGYRASLSMLTMKMTMTIWATTDVPFDLDKYLEIVSGNVLKVQMRLDAEGIEEFAKVPGFWIKTETEMELMGRKTRSTYEVLEITRESSPRDTYSIPGGYERLDTLFVDKGPRR